MTADTRIGRRFAKLVVVDRDSPRRYLCKCDCGGTKTVMWEHLRRGVTKSCGCLRGEVALADERHHSRPGAQQHPLYQTWRGMLRRCYDKNHQGYPLYGGRGVTVCDAWRKDFWAFADYVGPRKDHETLDRYPARTGNYEPGNVRWATPKQQATNSDGCLVVMLRGERVTSAEAARVIGVSDSGAIKARRDGFPPHEALALAKLRAKAAAKQREGALVDWEGLKKLIPAAVQRLGLAPV